MKRAIHSILIIVTLLLLGCEEHFLPNVEYKSNSLVVEAMLTDVPDFFTVKLSFTSAFNSNNYGQYETKARVYLKTTEGDVIYCNEISPGFYQSTERIVGEPDKEYYLQIKTNDGDEYSSEVEQMPFPTNIDSVGNIDTIYHEISYDDRGNSIIREYPGVMFKVKPSAPFNPNVGFLYKWKAFLNYDIETEGLAKINYYCWKKLASTEIQIYDYDLNTLGNTLLIDDLHFLSYRKLSPFPLDSSRFDGEVGSVVSESFYYELEQYTVTQKGAEFWKSLKRQSEATGKLFDPVEEELVSNIYCVSDSTKKAYGYFNTASYTKKDLGIILLGGGLGRIFDTNYYPEINSDEDCLVEQLPSFWLY